MMTVRRFGRSVRDSALFTLLAIVAVACGQDSMVDDNAPTPGIEVWLDSSGRPVNSVHVPGNPGQPFRVKVYDHTGKMVSDDEFTVEFTDLANVLGSLPAEMRARIPELIPRIARALSESLPPEARSKIPRAIEMLADELSPDERERLLLSVREEVAR